jgi:predicted oxidoreductase
MESMMVRSQAKIEQSQHIGYFWLYVGISAIASEAFQLPLEQWFAIWSASTGQEVP